MLKNFQVIEVISSKTKAQLTFYTNKIKFNHPTAVDLGFPKYVQLISSPSQHAFGIMACEKDAENAVTFFNRPQDSKPYPVVMSYTAALELITNMMNWTDDSKYYVVPGQRFADEKAIVFNLDDAESFAIKTLKGGDENKSDDE